MVAVYSIDYRDIPARPRAWPDPVQYGMTAYYGYIVARRHKRGPNDGPLRGITFYYVRNKPSVVPGGYVVPPVTGYGMTGGRGGAPSR